MDKVRKLFAAFVDFRRFSAAGDDDARRRAFGGGLYTKAMFVRIHCQRRVCIFNGIMECVVIGRRVRKDACTQNGLCIRKFPVGKPNASAGSAV